MQELLDLKPPFDGGNVHGQRKKAASALFSDEDMSDGALLAPARAGVLLCQSALVLLPVFCVDGSSLLEFCRCFLFSLRSMYKGSVVSSICGDNRSGKRVGVT